MNILDDNSPSSASFSKSSKRTEAEARYERLWLNRPEKFDPMRNAIERERVARTEALVREFTLLSGARVADLGCGTGTFAFFFRDSGAKVDAIDISSNALKRLKEKNCANITLKQDYVPKTTLADEAYDLVAALDLIAYLDPADYRTAFAEMARLVKENGHAVCSTPIDLDSTDALARFASLAETEFTVLKWRLSYHRLAIRWINFFLAPKNYVRAYKDPQRRKKELEKRDSFRKFWFRMNSAAPLVFLWHLLQYLTTPAANFILQSKKTVLFLEGISRFLWQENGISHAIFIGKLRPLLPPTEPEMQPREMKHKKQVWE